MIGLLGVTSYNIRIPATQRYVPDEKKGRFNGAFNTLSMIGILAGEAFAGVLSLKIPLRIIVMIICLSIGMVTPPFGVNMFISANITKVAVDKQFKWIFLLVGACLLGLLAVIACPWLTLGLLK